MKTGKAWMKIIASLLVIIGALNWGAVGAFNTNLVTLLAQTINMPALPPYVYMLVGLAALVHLFDRNFYLPFLGKAVFPCGPLVPKKPKDADTQVTIQTHPNANVIYWASETADDIKANPWIAYDQHTNAGVARSDSDGLAVLHVRSPSSYKVRGKTLKPHVHYRVCKKPGMMGPVETVHI